MKRKNGLKVHTGQMMCACPEHDLFMAEWTTARPCYKNRAHKMRAYRARRAAREAEDQTKGSNNGNDKL